MRLSIFSLCVLATFASIPASATTSVSLISPTTGTTVGAPVSVQAKASSTHGVSGWVVYIDGSNAYQADNNSNTLSVSLSVPAGSHSVMVRAWDKVSGYGSSPKVSFSVAQPTSTSTSATTSSTSTSTPTTTSVSVVSPAANSSAGNPVLFSATASSPHGIAGWVIYVDGANAYQADNNSNNVSTSLNLASGTHTVMFRAWDKVSGYGSSPKYTFSVGQTDTSSPTPTPTPTPAATSVTVLSPMASATVGSPVLFQATATSPNGVSGWVIYADGANVYQVNNGSGTLAASVNLPTGSHNVFIRAWDNVSGYGTSPSFNITVGNVTPTSAPPAGPQNGWLVVNVPNLQLTPAWRTYAPADCEPDPTVCSQNSQRFWEEWDFGNFSSEIDAGMAAIASQGKYKGIIPLLPLGDTPTYWNNIHLLYNAAAAHGLGFDPTVFPDYKFGAEYCYLYDANAPAECPTIDGTTATPAIAHQQMLKLMSFVENLGGACTNGTYNHKFAIWYGWPVFSPGYAALKAFWDSLPSGSCNEQAAYVPWLDTPYSATPEVAQLQKYVTGTLNRPLWVNTELYSGAQLTTDGKIYAPYQMVITGVWGAVDVNGWGSGMCTNWKSISSPDHLAVWTLSDRDDFTPTEQYRSYVDGSMADVTKVCTY